MKTRVKTNKMAELETDEQETYSFTECQKIGKDFLDEVKQSLVRENMEKEESRVKATKYLEETAILHLLEDLIAKLVFKRPEKPIDYLVKEMEELKRKGTQAQTEDKAT
ncbi:unnamed protein product [Porites evermanni]|uniref:Uncharacterized protein n=1 Tax=Porites evermanni TaxID=104178 RepID=A0ABN8LLG2_9CNID|nr:unnamed protein product [Porites evermanni]